MHVGSQILLHKDLRTNTVGCLSTWLKVALQIYQASWPKASHIVRYMVYVIMLANWTKSTRVYYYNLVYNNCQRHFMMIFHVCFICWNYCWLEWSAAQLYSYSFQEILPDLYKISWLCHFYKPSNNLHGAVWVSLFQVVKTQQPSFFILYCYLLYNIN